MSDPYAMVGEILTTTGPSRAAVVIQDGKIAVGCDADFVLLDAEGTVLETIVAGETVYKQEKNEHS